jgi:hypothetical protein|tara:strand:- start:1432 stop:2112 length:681 start_codon:yes stop_codon:yes gene_type:complete
MNPYEQKQLLKLERYQNLAQKAKKESEAAYEMSNSYVAGIPFGQPILVGHHSERAHRNALKRSWNAMDKRIELRNKAKYFQRRAEGIINKNSISSDDPEAIIKLKEKIQKLEEKREKIQQLKKEGKEFPHYTLPYIGQNIRRLKQRIQYLERIRKIEEKEEEINEVKIKICQEDNRVKLYFPGIPSEEIRTKLKRNGFRWSRYNGCWQAYLNEWKIQTAKEIAEIA